MDAYKQSSLWKTAFPDNTIEFPQQRKRIIEAYERFRERVSLLLQQIQKELPSLTLHDITHVDALWQVASEIAGPNYPLNPAEALVLGGAFLLHDAAHCRAAYPGGLDEIRKLNEWCDAAARRNLDPVTLAASSEDFQAVLFDTLRILHPKQAKTLAFAKWKDTTGDEFLFSDSDLRNAYGDLFGEIAESHWFHPHQLEIFGNSPKTAPVCLAPANWTVDPLKIAVLLRTADACHLDAKRAPRFLMLLNQPTGTSAVHWQFQSKINQVKCDVEREELLITGSPFGPDEQAAWWQAYDTACLADRELSAADALLRDFHGQRLAAREIAGARSPERFAKQIPTKGWYPVDTSLRISNIQSVVERFGGEKLYGDKPWLAVRELIQNARDAIHAARSLGYLNEDEGEIEVAIEDVGGGHWLHVTDNGIGMSRYVLTEVLLDFGHSLWHSADLSGEWSGLAASGFEAVGQFGIGFFSVFMLGEKVRVCTRRSEAKDDAGDHLLLEFNTGPEGRPLLRLPLAGEKLKRHGTRVSVFLTAEKRTHLCINDPTPWVNGQTLSIVQTCAHLAPALDINLCVRENGNKQSVIAANDWETLDSQQLLQRISPNIFKEANKKHFKGWLHLTDIRDSHGKLIGRCAMSSRFVEKSALGVNKGILAGYINGMTGVILSKPQTDLARQSALPDISRRDLQTWAEQQKNILSNRGALNLPLSQVLAEYGANQDHLIIGTIGRKVFTRKAFQDRLSEMDSLVVHRGEITHEGDDGVKESSFKDFVPEPNLLALNQSYRSKPSWMGEIPSNGIADQYWSISHAFETALFAAWGDESHWEEGYEQTVVGTVDGTEIERACDVYTRLPTDDE